MTSIEKDIRYLHDFGIRSHTIAMALGISVDEVDVVRDEYDRDLRRIEQDYIQNGLPRIREEINAIRSMVAVRSGDVSRPTQELIERARMHPITDLVKSRNGMASCPFHADKNPSMDIRKNFYHCYSCGESGDVIDLVMKLEGLTFKQAVERLS